MVLLVPPIFRAFARVIAPFAPKTEFTFLVIVALLCAFITRELGVYYLVGAFVVGLTAVRLRKDLPELSSEKLLGGVELFAPFFIPFYFLKAGLHLRAEHVTWTALAIGAALLVTVLPIRIVRVALHRRLALDEPWKVGARIGTAVIPTLVFTIVIAEILRERFNLSPELFGALIIFTLVNTLIPGFALRLPTPEFETPEVPQNPGSASRHGPSSRGIEAGVEREGVGAWDVEGDAHARASSATASGPTSSRGVTSTERFALWTTCSATLPDTRRSNQLRRRVPTTTRSASCSRASPK